MVMCSDPVTRTPASGFCGAYFSRIAIKPGISCSAIETSLRPQSARLRSATLYSVAVRLRVTDPIYRLFHDSVRGYLFFSRLNSSVAESDYGHEHHENFAIAQIVFPEDPYQNADAHGDGHV